MINRKLIKEVGLLKWIVRTGIRQFHKRVLKRDLSMLLPTGRQIHLPQTNYFSSEVWLTEGDVDWGSEAVFYSMLPEKNSVFLDVGSHIGYYALYMLPKCSKVICFEPDPRVRKFLKLNVDGEKNVEVVSYAVGQTAGVARFTLEGSAELSHLSVVPDSGETQIDVQVVSIDTFVSERNLIVDGIKIDAEGLDIAIVSGALKVLATQRPLVITEAIPEKALFDILAGVGYRIFAFARDRNSRKKIFVEIKSENFVLSNLVTKMLFLVPPRLTDAFEKLTTRIADHS